MAQFADSQRATAIQRLCKDLEQIKLIKSLTAAIKDNDFDAVRMCLINGADPNMYSNIVYKAPPLILAVTDYHDDDGSSEDETGSPDGNHYYVPRHANTQIMAALLDNGANINARDTQQETALSYCARFLKPSAAKFLIEHGASTELSPPHPTTILHWTVYRDREMTKLLLDLGVNIDMRNCYGETPLMEAVGYMVDNPGDLNIVQDLINRGAHVNARDKYGKTVLEQLDRRDFGMRKWKLRHMLTRAHATY